jgi:hypothetical protein
MARRALFCRRCISIRCVFAANYQAREARVNADLMRSFNAVALMLVLDRSLSNREYNITNLLKALVSTLSMFSLHAMLLSKIASRHFTPFTKRMFGPFHVTRFDGRSRVPESRLN